MKLNEVNKGFVSFLVFVQSHLRPAQSIESAAIVLAQIQSLLKSLHCIGKQGHSQGNHAEIEEHIRIVGIDFPRPEQKG